MIFYSLPGYSNWKFTEYTAYINDDNEVLYSSENGAYILPIGNIYNLPYTEYITSGTEDALSGKVFHRSPHTISPPQAVSVSPPGAYFNSGGTYLQVKDLTGKLTVVVDTREDISETIGRELSDALYDIGLKFRIRDEYTDETETENKVIQWMGTKLGWEEQGRLLYLVDRCGIMPESDLKVEYRGSESHYPYEADKYRSDYYGRDNRVFLREVTPPDSVYSYKRADDSVTALSDLPAGKYSKGSSSIYVGKPCKKIFTPSGYTGSLIVEIPEYVCNDQPVYMVLWKDDTEMADVFADKYVVWYSVVTAKWWVTREVGVLDPTATMYVSGDDSVETSTFEYESGSKTMGDTFDISGVTVKYLCFGDTEWSWVEDMQGLSNFDCNFIKYINMNLEGVT